MILPPGIGGLEGSICELPKDQFAHRLSLLSGQKSNSGNWLGKGISGKRYAELVRSCKIRCFLEGVDTQNLEDFGEASFDL